MQEIATLEELHAFEACNVAVRVLQVSASWCKRCGTLREELAGAFDGAEGVALGRIVIDEVEGAEEALDVGSMPRVDILGKHRVQLSGSNCVLGTVLAEVARARPPVLILDEDF